MKRFSAWIVVLFWIGSPVFAGMPAPGAEVWKFLTGGAVFASPAMGPDGSVYVGSEDGLFYALSSGGGLKWVFTAGDWIDSTAAVHEGTVYFGSWDNYLYALDAATGALKWQFETGGPILSSPAVAPGGTVYAGSGDGLLYALTPEGTLKWFAVTLGAVDASPAVAPDGTVYAASYDGCLYAFSPQGEALWTYCAESIEGLDSRIHSSPAIGPDGTVYFGSGNGHFYAVSPEGMLLWDFAALDKVDSSPAVGPDGTVYFASRDGYLYAVDDGLELWSFLIGDVYYASPALGSDGLLYIAAYAEPGVSELLAVRPSGNGESWLAWTASFAAINDSSALLTPQGELYIGMNDGFLYKFAAGEGPADSSWPQFRAGPARQGRVPEPGTDYLWENTYDFGGGLRQSVWFGYFSEAFFPWIYHFQWRWLYCCGTAQESIWFWHDRHGWFWTGRAVYPFVYRARDPVWLWYYIPSTNPMWFTNFNTGGLESY